MVRRTAAVMVADIAGHGRIMGGDAAATLARVPRWRADLFEPLVKRHRGRIVTTTGDGALVEGHRYSFRDVPVLPAGPKLQSGRGCGHSPAAR